MKFGQLCTFYYLKADNAATTSPNINDVYGMKTASERTVQHWFQEFRHGDMSFEDEN